MVDSLVSSTIQVLLEKAISLATDRIGLVFGFKKDMESLRGSAAMMVSVLADADDKQRHSRAVQLWLKRLEEVAFDADNVLDELNYEILRRKVEYRNRTFNGNKVCFFFSFSNFNIAFRWRMASKVRDVVVKLKTINQEADEFGLISKFQMAAVLPITPATGVTVNRKTDSLVGQNVIGRANDESRIVEMLLSSSQDNVSVIPIVGMGGLGKTTLAKSIYNNQKINGHFSKKIWVCVSENFDVMELLRLILESLTSTKVELENRDTVVQNIRKQLEGERYLLVLDDVWNEIPELWEDFFHSLVGLSAANGTWCLVATCLLKVASIVTSNPPYLLGKLSDNDCWNILIEKAIASEEVPEELNSMRKEIVKRCCGLPLASNVVGSLLRIKMKEEWLSILENWLLNKSGDKNSIEQILKLSFDHLPSPSVKKCFAYCSTFAKDAKLDRDQLIKLWMVEGFLQPDLRTETTMEEIGENYCRILLESTDKWEVSYCIMHDLVHDLAKSVSKSDSINLESGVTDTNYQVRYLELNSSTDETLQLLENSSMLVHTLSLQSSILGDPLQKFRNLNVLKLFGTKIMELLTAIGKLIHLRFIDVSASVSQILPESLCKLYNLQTLRMVGCYKLKSSSKRDGQFD
ncbi:hypothetical protein ACH5RR_041367 [Cinchona calisaya]|uniref:Disease resistance protein RGA3 n=1 Tax=Cinchona calisaya TaxID=153742 RepID=A0ABD2XWN8_9GENT